MQVLLFIWLVSRYCTGLRDLVFMLVWDVASLWFGDWFRVGVAVWLTAALRVCSVEFLGRVRVVCFGFGRFVGLRLSAVIVFVLNAVAGVCGMVSDVVDSGFHSGFIVVVVVCGCVTLVCSSLVFGVVAIQVLLFSWVSGHVFGIDWTRFGCLNC